MPNLLTWNKEENELARRQHVGTFDSLEVREGNVAFHFSNGIVKEVIRGGKRTNWSPFRHDEIVWVSLAPFEIQTQSFTFMASEPTAIQLYASIRVKDPAIFVNTMLKGDVVATEDIGSWLQNSFKDAISLLLNGGRGTPDAEELARIKKFLNEHANMSGLEIMVVHYPEYLLPDIIAKKKLELIGAKLDLEIAPLKRDNFNIRIDAILSALERVQKPDQEIKLKAIEALKEWSKKTNSNIIIGSPPPTPYYGNYPPQQVNYPAIVPSDSDSMIVKKLIEMFEKDPGGNKFAEALKDILLESDFMRTEKQVKNNGEGGIAFDPIQFKSALRKAFEAIFGPRNYEITISSFIKSSGVWKVEGSIEWFTESERQRRDKLTSEYEQLNRKRLELERKGKDIHKIHYDGIMPLLRARNAIGQRHHYNADYDATTGTLQSLKY